MKVLTICGTRPELIRLNFIIKKLDKYCNQILIHTGQNFSKELNEIFFDELQIRQPNYFLNAIGSFANQISIMFPSLEKIIKKENPDKILILGDTNSSLCSIVAKRMQIPVFHIESGNRSHNSLSPEETNRKIIDHCTNIHLTYTQRSKENLMNEGISLHRIFVVGNPITEIIQYYKVEIERSVILKQLKLNNNKYFLVTLHREENVDNEEKLRIFMNSFYLISKEFQLSVLFSCHPRTKNNLKRFNIEENCNVKIIEPIGFFDFVKLEKNAFCILTDSGTVQEESNILNIPCVILREITERPETIEEGNVMVSGCNENSILNCIKICVNSDRKKQKVVYEYQKENTSDIVIKILLGNYFKTEI
jgi:UDP-N-acetylglucosamine 2-epimerase (non-hydrolysing)